MPGRIFGRCEQLNLARSIVSMSLEEIAFNLSKYGFINNGKQWLGAKKNQ
jgi:hypothetical protein